MSLSLRRVGQETSSLGASADGFAIDDDQRGRGELTFVLERIDFFTARKDLSSSGGSRLPRASPWRGSHRGRCDREGPSGTRWLGGQARHSPLVAAVKRAMAPPVPVAWSVGCDLCLEVHRRGQPREPAKNAVIDQIALVCAGQSAPACARVPRSGCARAPSGFRLTIVGGADCKPPLAGAQQRVRAAQSREPGVG